MIEICFYLGAEGLLAVGPPSADGRPRLGDGADAGGEAHHAGHILLAAAKTGGAAVP